jgi:hypothetical protein
MKRTSFILVFAALVLSFGLANGQNGMSLDNVVGNFHYAGAVPVGDTVQTNTQILFNIRLTNNYGANITGATNGFEVYSPDGATWDTTTHIPWLNGFVVEVLFPGWNAPPYFNDNIFINPYSFTGSGADTIGLGGNSKPPSPGIPDGFSEVVYQVGAGPIAASDAGKQICIDSCWYRPANDWLWSSDTGVFGTFGADWDGPHCFTIYEVPNLPPVCTSTDPLPSFDHCALAQYQFTATDAEGDPITWALTSGPGTITAGGAWSYQPTLADVGASITLVVTPSDLISAGTACTADLNFTNQAPAFTAGCNATVVKSGGETATADVNAADPDGCDNVTFTLGTVTPAPVGTVSVDANTGLITFMTDVLDSDIDYVVEVCATDGDETVCCNVNFEIISGSPIKICIETGTQADEAYQGTHYQVDVTLEKTSFDIGGFDILIAYDNSALSFQTATEGAEFYADGCKWEYFTYRYGADGNCSGGCPSGLLRVVGIAETNNGTTHPECSQPAVLPAVMFTLDFLITNDRTFECQFIPIRFFWLSCADNAVSSADGNTLYVENQLFDAQFPDLPVQQDGVGYPTYLGAQSSDCFVGDSTKAPLEAIDFCNGGIHIACADSIDARGDINLNEIGYEIADAVLFSNYFVYGPSVFIKNLPGQVAASDVNADGIALSVADLVYLIRVVVGDALPYPKLSPVEASYTISANGTVNVNAPMGAAFVLVEGEASVNLLAENMELAYNFDGQNTRILVYSDPNAANVENFEGNFLQVTGNIISIEMGSADGAPVVAKLELPTAYALNQNYPNPFNPSTTIGFALPVAGDYTLTVFNVLGQNVARFSGTETAGNHSVVWNADNQASGIYFYKLDAGNFSETKKMVFLK